MRVLDSYSQASGQDSCFCVSYYGRTSAALLLSRGGMRNLGRCRMQPCKAPWNGSKPWWLRLRLGLGTSPLDLFAFPFGVQHTKLLARPYPVINPALRATAYAYGNGANDNN